MHNKILQVLSFWIFDGMQCNHHIFQTRHHIDLAPEWDGFIAQVAIGSLSRWAGSQVLHTLFESRTHFDLPAQQRTSREVVAQDLVRVSHQIFETLIAFDQDQVLTWAWARWFPHRDRQICLSLVFDPICTGGWKQLQVFGRIGF